MLVRIVLSAVVFAFTTAGAPAGSVSGRATDEDGAPLAGVKVEVVYQTYTADQLNSYGASIKGETVTGADGSYTISTDGLPPGEYYALAYRVLDNGGREIVIELVADDPSGFASTDDVTRDFVNRWVEVSEELPYGNGGIFVLNNAIDDYTQLDAAEVTLVGLDTGRTHVKTVRRTGEGLVVTGIPFGTYRASVSLGGKPLKIALFGYPAGEFADSVVHDFTMGYLGTQFVVQVKP